MKPFLYIIIREADEDVEGSKDELIGSLRLVLAADENQVRVLAGAELPEEEVDNLDRIKVFVRPF